jgi:hypothetical protein
MFSTRRPISILRAIPVILALAAFAIAIPAAATDPGKNWRV